jgi:hypothetical protein
MKISNILRITSTTGGNPTKEILLIPYSRSTPTPYIGRYGPNRKPGLVHLPETNLLKNNSDMYPKRAPITNKVEIMISIFMSPL